VDCGTGGPAVGGEMCSGNQCCPDGTPCPSAARDFVGCTNNKKTHDCLAPNLVTELIGAAVPSPASPVQLAGTCEIGSAVSCSSGGSLCTGGQCCPDGHPCPSSDPSFHSCANGFKLEDCTGVPTPPPGTCFVGDLVDCNTGGPAAGGEMCAGNQCCPNGTPCPSASSDFHGCTSSKKIHDCTQSATPTPAPTGGHAGGTCQIGEAVSCSSGRPLCTGGQCCPDGHPCPSSDPSFHSCAHGFKLEDCTGVPTLPPVACMFGDLVDCNTGGPAAGGEMCSGNQCCPNGTPCPSAARDFVGCTNSKKTHDCLAPAVMTERLGSGVPSPAAPVQLAGTSAWVGAAVGVVFMVSAYKATNFVASRMAPMSEPLLQ